MNFIKKIRKNVIIAKNVTQACKNNIFIVMLAKNAILEIKTTSSFVKNARIGSQDDKINIFIVINVTCALMDYIKIHTIVISAMFVVKKNKRMNHITVIFAKNAVLKDKNFIAKIVNNV